jgi:hypothetical protein
MFDKGIILGMILMFALGHIVDALFPMPPNPLYDGIIGVLGLVVFGVLWYVWRHLDQREDEH